MTPSAIPVPTVAPTGPAPYERQGLLRVVSNKEMMDEEKRKAEQAQAQPVMTSLAGYIRTCWDEAYRYKQTEIEPRILKSLRARRGEYDPQKLAEIRKTGGSEIYMLLTSTKCRSATAYLRDALLGQGDEKPWTIKPTPIPDINPQLVQGITSQVVQELMQAAGLGIPVSEGQVIDRVGAIRDKAMVQIREQAKRQAERMEQEMEDQLIEGGLRDALNDFLDDLTTYPSAIIKGPVLRRKKKVVWGAQGIGVKDYVCKDWERVDPGNAYPSPNSTGFDDGYFIEKHRLSRTDLQEMIGVDGYNEEAIRAVLEDYGRGGLTDWTLYEATRAAIEGRQVHQNPEGLIDALQYWGSVQGTKLLEWGMPEEQIPDPLAEYNVEAWLIGRWVIKATLNYDPLGRKPYYKTSYEDRPGQFWGNSLCDLLDDVQSVCNAAARSLVNNMGFASGPQVAVNVQRLPAGETVTSLYPWKIHQFISDPMGSTADAVQFFQPNPMVNELLMVFEKFSQLADDYSGLPRYMMGNEKVGGAGRTASGLSMLMNAAGKTIKQVVINIDVGVITPLLELLYYHNMRFGREDVTKGDVRIVARGATSLIAKEALQLRRNEFLQLTSNPVDLQIVGPAGRAELLREIAKTLEMDTDKLVPPPELIRAMAGGMAPPQGGGQQQPAPGGGQQLMNGAPVTDNFSPMPT